jgi:hypothetical protein
VSRRAHRIQMAALPRSVVEAVSVFIITCILLLPTGLCLAEEGTGDGVYRRLEGDLTLSGGISGGLALGNDQTLAVDLRARYLDSIGVAVIPEWSVKKSESAVALALEVRPLFLARFLSNAYSGRAWVDLIVDSIGVEIGSWLGPCNRHFGAALLLGGGIEFPLSRRADSGLGLRLASRYLRAAASDRAAPSGGASELSFIAALIYRTTVGLGLASWEPVQ